MDESAARRTVCYLLPFVARSWAPRGQTPLLLEQAGRAHLSLIAAISPTGRLYLAAQDQPFNSDNISASAVRLVLEQTLLAIPPSKYANYLAGPPVRMGRPFTDLKPYETGSTVDPAEFIWNDCPLTAAPRWPNA